MTNLFKNIVNFCKKIVTAPAFDKLIISIIIVNAIVIGLETSPRLIEQFGHLFELFNAAVLVVFVVEAALKITAEAPRIDRYFRRGWNVFDFTIVVLSLLPAVGQFATAARLVRILRVARLISMVPELRVIIWALMRSLPSMLHIVMLLGVLFYIYGVIGFYLFHVADPVHWGNLGSALLTLFGIVTLEAWVDVMRLVLPVYPFAWLYFISFIVVGTFMFVNLFVAVVINNLSDAKKEALEDLNVPVTKDELLKELRETKEALLRLEQKLHDRH